jgi:peptide/nickel transport system permease protein
MTTSHLATTSIGLRPIKKARPWIFYLCVGILGFFVLMAIFAPWIVPYDPSKANFADKWLPASPQHWFGTDQLGRDILSRIIAGSRDTLLGALALLIFASIVGVSLGLIAAWKRGWVDTLLARVTDVMYAFPGLLFVILIIAVFDTGTFTSVVGMGLAFVPTIAKFTRTVALSEIARPYVDSYRLQGVGGFVLCVRYLLPNMLPTLIGYLVVLFGDGLVSLAGLNFLGFGAQPPSSDWGLMVSEARDGVIQGVFSPALIPGLTIALVVVATNVAGVRLADRLAVRK